MGDEHDFFITPTCTAVFPVYQTVKYDLTHWGIDYAHGYLQDALFQEVDLATNKLLFQWRASDHVDIRDCYFGTSADGAGVDPNTGFDFFHMNSIEKDHLGNYLISARHTHTLYYISGIDGSVLWTIGGHNSSFTDISNGLATDFAWQHDARWASDDLTTITVFDNRHIETVSEAPASRGMVLKLDYEAMTVNLTQSYDATSGIKSVRMGSMQMLRETPSNVLLGYGNEPGFTEFSANGTVLWDVLFGPLWTNRASADNYRAEKTSWKGYPTWNPKIAAGPADPSILLTSSESQRNLIRPNLINDTAYFSWNGATEVASWVILASKSTPEISNYSSTIATIPKAGFETSLKISNEARYVRAVAVSADNELLVATDVLDMSSGQTISDAPPLIPEGWTDFTTLSSSTQDTAASAILHNLTRYSPFALALFCAAILGCGVVIALLIRLRHQRGSCQLHSPIVDSCSGSSPSPRWLRSDLAEKVRTGAGRWDEGLWGWWGAIGPRAARARAASMARSAGSTRSWDAYPGRRRGASYSKVEGGEEDHGETFTLEDEEQGDSSDDRRNVEKTA